MLRNGHGGVGHAEELCFPGQRREQRCVGSGQPGLGAEGDEIGVERRTPVGVEMGGGLGPLAGKVWRIGVMGHNAQTDRVEKFLGVLEEALSAERK